MRRDGNQGNKTMNPEIEIMQAEIANIEAADAEDAMIDQMVDDCIDER